MSSNDVVCVGDTAVPMAVDNDPAGAATLDALMAEIKGMRNRMDEMETSKQNEVDSMKSRISQLEIRIILWKDH